MAVPSEERASGAFAAEQCVERYMAGFYPYFDPHAGAFVWDRAERRSVIRMRPQALAVAVREIRKQRREFEIRTDNDFATTIQLLSNAALRPDTWIKHDVISVYATLFTAGYAHTIEAYSQGQLVGCLLGVHLGEVFCAEAMIGTDKAAPPYCLYSLVAAYPALGLRVVDVQVSHQPGSACRKLGEETMTLADYLALAAPLMRNPSATFALSRT